MSYAKQIEILRKKLLEKEQQARNLLPFEFNEEKIEFRKLQKEIISINSQLRHFERKQKQFLNDLA